MARKKSEAWAAKNCDTNVEAQEIMSKRIKRVRLEINEGWPLVVATARARWAVTDPVVAPMNVNMGKGFTYNLKGRKLGHIGGKDG